MHILDEASRILTADPHDLILEGTSYEVIGVNTSKTKLACFLNLASSGIPIVMNNQAALQKLELLMGEFGKHDAGVLLPPGLRLGFKEFHKKISSIFNAYRQNYDRIVALTIPGDNRYEPSDQIRDVEQQVKDRQQSLQAVVNEITDLEREELALQRQKMEIKKRLKEIRHQREAKFDEKVHNEDN